jgi:hypothetical protein
VVPAEPEQKADWSPPVPNSTPDPNSKPRITLVPAGPAQQAPDQSGPRPE